MTYRQTLQFVAEGGGGGEIGVRAKFFIETRSRTTKRVYYEIAAQLYETVVARVELLDPQLCGGKTETNETRA